MFRNTRRTAAVKFRQELNVLKHLMALAVEWELIPANPVYGVKPPRVPAGLVRYLQSRELRAVVTEIALSCTVCLHCDC
jgi:hypothetical protein